MPRHQSIPLLKMFWSWNTSFECDCWDRSWDCKQSNARANHPVIICLFKFSKNNIETLKQFKCNKKKQQQQQQKTEWLHCHCYTVFKVNFEQISHPFFVFSLLTLIRQILTSYIFEVTHLKFTFPYIYSWILVGV